MHDNEQIDRLEYSFRIRSYNPTSSINLKIWLDDFEVYTKRESQYITTTITQANFIKIL
jgi:hypothetical protein